MTNKSGRTNRPLCQVLLKRNIARPAGPGARGGRLKGARMPLLSCPMYTRCLHRQQCLYHKSCRKQAACLCFHKTFRSEHRQHKHYGLPCRRHSTSSSRLFHLRSLLHEYYYKKVYSKSFSYSRIWHPLPHMPAYPVEFLLFLVHLFVGLFEQDVHVVPFGHSKRCRISLPWLSFTVRI